MENKKEEKPIEMVEKKEAKVRTVIIETDGNKIAIKLNELTLLELREIGRQLMNLQ